MLLTFLQGIPDHRRAQGRMYDLTNILLLSILAILSQADSYRNIASFIKIHFSTLKKEFGIKWKKPPGYTTIRNVIQGTDSDELEKAFRTYSKSLLELAHSSSTPSKALLTLAFDGKTLRGSFDHFQDKKAVQILSVFATKEQIILAHKEIEDKKTNEIPVMQEVIKELGLENSLFTADAINCQKKL